MEKLLDKIQEQLDNGWAVEADDIQDLVDCVKTGQHKPIVMRIREKCEEEIKWVKDSLDEHAKLSNYTEADEHYLPGYRKAFEEILEMLKGA